MKEILYGQLWKHYEAEDNRSCHEFKYYSFERMIENGDIRTQKIKSNKDVKCILYQLSREGWVAYAITETTYRTAMEALTDNIYHLQKTINEKI